MPTRGLNALYSLLSSFSSPEIEPFILSRERGVVSHVHVSWVLGAFHSTLDTTTTLLQLGIYSSPTCHGYPKSLPLFILSSLRTFLSLGGEVTDRVHLSPSGGFFCLDTPNLAKFSRAVYTRRDEKDSSGCPLNQLLPPWPFLCIVTTKFFYFEQRKVGASGVLRVCQWAGGMVGLCCLVSFCC